MLGKFPMDKVVKDVVTSYMSILESEAGIMPRAIHHIFQGLQRLVYKEIPLNQRKLPFSSFSLSRILFSMWIIP